MFGVDKLLHVAVSFALTFIDPVLAVFLGIAKEIVDPFIGGVSDAFDVLANGIGILAALWVG